MKDPLTKSCLLRVPEDVGRVRVGEQGVGTEQHQRHEPVPRPHSQMY